MANASVGHSDMFVSQNAIYANDKLGTSASWFREACEFDYGIIPYPKYDEAQETYYTVPGGSINAAAIPLTVKRGELVSVLFAALSAETGKNVIPQYYDVVLKYKGTRDEVSIAMIDTILDGRNLNYEFFYDGFNGFFYKIPQILQGNVALPTYVQQNENAVMAHYEKVRDLFFPD